MLFKYRWNAATAGRDVCGLYSVRMEANHAPADVGQAPTEVTFAWNERQENYTTIRRSHTQLVKTLPCTYEIAVGGVDHPVMESVRVKLKEPHTDQRMQIEYGYSDEKDTPDAERFQDRWVTYGRNLAEKKPYDCTVPSRDNWGAGDPEEKILTDGIVGPPYTGGVAYRYGAIWKKGDAPVVTIDLGRVEKCAAFRIQAGGYPWWDALEGEVLDQVEVQTSINGMQYTSQGSFNFKLRWKDIPVNEIWPDEEALRAPNYLLILPKPSKARYVRFAITPERFFSVSEVQVLDSVTYKPFDLKIALPDIRNRSDISQYNPKHVPSKPRRTARQPTFKAVARLVQLTRHVRSCERPRTASANEYKIGQAYRYTGLRRSE